MRARSRLSVPGAALAMGLVLAGCQGGRDDTAQALSAARDWPLQSGSSLAGDGTVPGCDWFLVFDPEQEGGNSAFPDTGARYWLAVVSGDAPAGSRLRIEGHYPDARFFSLAAENSRLATVDVQADYELLPDPGSVNPFLGPAHLQQGFQSGGRYTAYLVPQMDIPDPRERNTLYRPAGLLETIRPTATLLAYRIYLPRGTRQGRVPLPRLSLEIPGQPDVALSRPEESAECAEIAAAFAEDGAVLPGSSLLADPRLPPRFPRFTRYNGVLGTGLVGQGVAYNPQNGLLFAKTARRYGDMLIVRGLAPRHAQGPDPAQVRYWSLCSYGLLSQSVQACLADEDAHPDAAGYFTLVVTPDAEPPAFVERLEHVDWLPWAAANWGVVTMRELLADEGFAEATVRIGPLASPAAIKGEYMPRATYCSQAVFESAAPRGSAEVFAACRSASQLLP